MAKNGNGEGSIYPHKKNGKKVGYRGAYWVHTAEGSKRRYVSGKTRDEVHDKLIEVLEAVMNSIRNGIGMRETEIAKEPSRSWNPHSYAVFTQVHNTL
jgi:hypothetical protein